VTVPRDYPGFRMNVNRVRSSPLTYNWTLNDSGSLAPWSAVIVNYDFPSDGLRYYHFLTVVTYVLSKGNGITWTWSIAKSDIYDSPFSIANVFSNSYAETLYYTQTMYFFREEM
jgi:hypothetical protein